MRIVTTTWTNLTTIANQNKTAVCFLNYRDASDEAEIDLRIVFPPAIKEVEIDGETYSAYKSNPPNKYIVSNQGYAFFLGTHVCLECYCLFKCLILA